MQQKSTLDFVIYKKNGPRTYTYVLIQIKTIHIHYNENYYQRKIYLIWKSGMLSCSTNKNAHEHLRVIKQDNKIFHHFKLKLSLKEYKF